MEEGGCLWKQRWRRRRDSNPRYSFPYDALAKRWFQPLTHVSERRMRAYRGRERIVQPDGFFAGCWLRYRRLKMVAGRVLNSSGFQNRSPQRLPECSGLFGPFAGGFSHCTRDAAGVKSDFESALFRTPGVGRSSSGEPGLQPFRPALAQGIGRQVRQAGQGRVRGRRGPRAGSRLTHLKPRRLEPTCGFPYMRPMFLGCLFGRHRPSLSSIARRQGGYVAICEHCARPLEKRPNGRWAASKPVYEAKDSAL
jgi:hypothetical protein